MERQIGAATGTVTRSAFGRAQQGRLQDAFAARSDEAVAAGDLAVSTIRELAGAMRSVVEPVADSSLRAQLGGLLDDLQATTASTAVADVRRRLGFLRHTVDRNAAELGAAGTMALRQSLAMIEHALDTTLDAAGSRAHGLLRTGRDDAAALLDKADGITGGNLDRAELAGHHLVEDAASHADDTIGKAIAGAERAASKVVKGAVEAIASSAAGIALGAGVALLAGAAAPVVVLAAAGGLAVGLGAWLLTH